MGSFLLFVTHLEEGEAHAGGIAIALVIVGSFFLLGLNSRPSVVARAVTTLVTVQGRLHWCVGQPYGGDVDS
jgi:hypothetical protein